MLLGVLLNCYFINNHKSTCQQMKRPAASYGVSLAGLQVRTEVRGTKPKLVWIQFLRRANTIIVHY